MLDDLQEPKTRSLEEYWEMVRRRRWLILTTVFVCWLVVWGIGWLIPPTYESEAAIAVQGEQVSDKLVSPNVLTSPTEQLEAIRERVLSRANLQSIIDRYHLYSHESRILSLFEPGDPVDKMTKDIKISLAVTPGREQQLTGFTISYGARSPQIANAVVARLANLFIQQNNATQVQQSQVTSSFFASQLEDARDKLNQQEAQVKAFKAQHVGELPDQLQSNMQILSGLQSQLVNVQNALAGSQQQKLYLESLVQQYQTAESSLDVGGDSAVSPSVLDKELKDLRMQLAQDLGEYTDSYPDVIALKDQIKKTEALKKRIDAEIAKNQKKQQKNGKDNSFLAADMHSGAPTPMMQIESQLKANQLQIASQEKAEKKLQAEINVYQLRLNMTPATEQQLAEVSLGEKEAQDNYNSLLQKQNMSQLASNYQQAGGGDAFSIIDPPSLPLQPSAPNHVLISVGGLAFGLAVAVGLTLLLELTGTRIRQEKDLEGVVSARVLVGIPTIITPLEHERRLARRWIERFAAVAIVVLILVGNIYAFYRG